MTALSIHASRGTCPSLAIAGLWPSIEGTGAVGNPGILNRGLIFDGISVMVVLNPQGDRMTANEWKSLHPWSISFKIVALYATVGVLWILFSDTLLDALVKDQATVTRISILKGWLYVLVTASLLFLLINRYIAMIQRNEEALRESEKRYFTLFKKAIPPFFWSIRKHVASSTPTRRLAFSTGTTRKRRRG